MWSTVIISPSYVILILVFIPIYWIEIFRNNTQWLSEIKITFYWNHSLNFRYLENNLNRSGDTNENDTPPHLAESCLRELVGRASFGHIRSVVRPALRHLDLHELWVPNHFAIHTFQIIMFSVQVQSYYAITVSWRFTLPLHLKNHCFFQAQYSYAVIESLMAHLDENSKASPKIRTSIADVLSKIIAIAAEESVGTCMLELLGFFKFPTIVGLLFSSNFVKKLFFGKTFSPGNFNFFRSVRSWNNKFTLDASAYIGVFPK